MLGPEEAPDGLIPSEDQVFRVDRDSIDANSAWELRPELLRALYTHGPVLWLDLARVNFIDSTGLGMLVGVLKEARSLEGDLHLMNVGREVRRLLQVTGLEAFFEQGAQPTGTPRAP